MPYSRPTLTDLRNQIWTDITTSLSFVVSLLQKAVLKIVGSALAALVFGLYGYLDWIAKQAVPWTAEDEYLAAWGALKNTYQKAATQTILKGQFTGTNGTPIAAGTLITRADNFTYATTSDPIVWSGSTVTVTMKAVTAGAAGNCDVNTAVTLASAIPGIQSSGTVSTVVTSGADVEKQEDFSGRVMQAFQQPVQGGDRDDYVTWAEQVSGVTRAWCAPNGFGPGTVVVYFMMDNAEASHSGFPQGTNGVSQYDAGPGGAPRDTPATGDQLTVADAIVTSQPVTALVYSCSPIENQVGFTIAGVSDATVRTNISTALADLFIREGTPGGTRDADGTAGGTVDLSDVNSEIGSVSGSGGYIINSITSTVGGVTTPYPANSNITNGTGQLPVLGTVTWA